MLALDSLDLDVPRGSIFGLLGPNGAGKTTTIRILTGLARASGGSASVAGVDVADDRPELRRRMGYVDQDPRFYGWMKGRELLELSARLAGIEGPELRSRVAETLKRTGLADAGERRIGAYSGGMRQRLGIAQAVIHEPELLILDEPVSSLDPEGRRDLLELIEGLRGTATVDRLDPRPRRRRADLRPRRDPRSRPARDGGPARRPARGPRPADLPARARRRARATR